MDAQIARLGVSIDPTEAVRGADKATQAAYKMGASFEKVVASWQAGQRLLDNTFKSIVSGIDRMAAAAMRSTGVVGDAFGLMVRSATFAAGALYNVLERAVKAFGMLGGAARAAGNAVGAGFSLAANTVRGVVNSITGSVSGIVNAFAQVGLAIQGFKSVTAPLTNFVSGAIGSASQMEGFQNRWAYLLGSFDKAKAKMGELQQFANTTPFNLPGVTEAALAMNRLSDANLRGIEGLKKVGDAAAIAQQPIEEVAQRIVRLSGNLQRGAGGGDELRALTEWGIISPKASAKIAEMSTDAGKFKDAMALVVAELDKTKNAMGLMAETWEGKTSTLEDSWNTLKTAIGQPIIEGLKPLIEDMTGLVDNFTAQIRALAPQIKEIVVLIPAAFRVMQQEGGLKLAFTAAMDFLNEEMRRTWEIVKIIGTAVFENIAVRFSNLMSVVASGEFWKPVGEALVNGVLAAMEALATAGTSGINRARDEAAKAKADMVYFTAALKALNGDIGTIQSRMAGGYNGDTDTAARARADDQRHLDALTEQLKTLTEEMKNFGKTVQTEPKPIPTWGEASGQVPFQTTNAITKFLADLFGYTKTIAKEQAEKAAANDSLVKKAAENRAAANAGEGDSLTKKESAKLAKEDARLDKLAQKYGEDADPGEKYEREKRELAELLAARKITEDRYQAMLKKTTEEYHVAMKKRKDDSLAAAQAEMTALQKLVFQWGQLKKNAQQATADIAASISNNVSSAFTDWITGTKSASQAFGDMARSIVKDIVSIIVKLWVQFMLSKALGMTLGGGAGLAVGGLGGGIGSALGSAIGGGVSGAFGGGGSSGSSSGSHSSGGGSSSGGGGGSSPGGFTPDPGVGGGLFPDGSGSSGGAGSSDPGNILGTEPPAESGGSESSNIPEIHHDGGVAGKSWRDAMRYHRGGVAGLRSGEVPAVLERGELIVPARESASARKRMLTGGGGAPAASAPNVTVLNFIDKAQFLAAAAENPDAVMNIIAMRREQLRAMVQKG